MPNALVFAMRVICESTSLNRTSEIKRQIESRNARIGIVGMGYVGLPLALLFSEACFEVSGFDVDFRKVETPNRCEAYIVRIHGTEIESALKKGLSSLRITLKPPRWIS